MRSIELKAEYRGYEIEWFDSQRQFRINHDGIETKAGLERLEDCQKWIDDRLKQKFKRVNVIHIGYRGELKKGIATSFTTECDRYTHQDKYFVWFTDTKQKRTKDNLDEFYPDNDNNAQILSQMADKAKQIKTLEGEIKELKSTLEPLTPEMMIITAEDKEKEKEK